VNRRSSAVAVVGALFAGAVLLIALEFSNGAAGAGSVAVGDPCAARPAYPGEGLDAVLQRIVLDGLDGAACELGASREELVLSLAPTSQAHIRWDDVTIERSLRAGLMGAIDDAEQRGSLGGIVAALLRQLVQHAPVQWLIDGGQGLAGLFG
jgi:hypothetical protein